MLVAEIGIYNSSFYSVFFLLDIQVKEECNDAEAEVSGIVDSKNDKEECIAEDDEEGEELGISEEQLAEIEMMKKMGLPVEFNFGNAGKKKKVR